MRGSNKYIHNPVSCCNLHVQLGFVLLIAAMTPSIAHAIVTGPTISNNTFASTAVGGSLTQTVSLTLVSAETIKSIALQPGQAGATEYAIQSISGCKVDNVTQSSVGTVCDVSIKFTPQLPGSTVSPTLARNATLLFTDSNSNVFAYGLTGAATGPVAKVVPGKVSLYAGVAATGLNALDLGLGLVTGGYGGDGGPATSATFNLTGVTAINSLLTQPLALDSAGNLYVADAGNFIIRKIDNTSAHTVTTIAGTPTVTGTSAGSGGLATSATLAYPHAITVDAAGNIFFIDAASQYSSYSIVYRIDAATKIITAIGGQLYNPSDGYNSAGGGTCVPNLGTPGYYECGDGGLADYASLPSARNLAVDAAGNLYLWESGGYIRKIVPSTGIITTFATAADFPSDVAGTPSFALGGMTLASDGNFYALIDAGSYELIYELNTTTQAVTQIAGGQQPNYLGTCDASGSVNGKPSAPIVDIAAGQAGYPGAQLFIFTNGVVASTGDLASDASGNIYYSGAQCNGADVYDYRPAVFRINLPTDTAYLETAGGSPGTATTNYGAYTGFNIAPASAIPDGNGNLYFTTNNQIGVISASAGALDFGQQNQFTTGITRIATYENVGNATDTGPTYSLETGLDFTDVSATDTNACNLLTQVGVNKTCNIDYEFTPIQPNNITDTINLAEASPGSNPGFGLTTDAQTVTLTGDATPEAQFVVTPASLSFGNVVVGQSVTKTFTVSNVNGGATLNLYGIYVYPNGPVSPPTEYTDAGTCDPSASTFSVVAGSSCTITITFTPTAVGSYPTTLTINNSVTTVEGQTFTITGAGIAASTPTATLSPATLPFGNQPVNTSVTGPSLTLSNTSSSTLNISSITIGGANPSDFSETTTCGSTLAANSTCMITVTFKPASAATFNATVSVADDAAGTPQTTTLSGTGTAPTATLSPSTLPFGNQPVNTSVTGPSLTLSNTSSSTLHISGITIDGANPSDFSETTTCGATLAANSTCTITVTFTPGSAVIFNATVSVADDATGTPQTTTLSGTGTAATSATATLTPNPLVFSTVQVGSYSIGTATLTNTGSSSLTNIAISFTGTNASAFATYPTSTCGTTLEAGDNCTIVIHFTPTSTGDFTATLSVADNATGAPQTIALTGAATAAPTAQVQFNPVQLNAIAGTGVAAPQCNDTGDGHAALQAQLCTPYAAVEDASGNIYFVDQDDNVVKKIDTSGTITTFAGVANTGPGSYSGDNGPATAANLSAPLDIAVDLLGNVYISDYGNGRIRKVDTGGTITTFVGGTNGYFNGGSGTGVALGPGGISFDLAGNLYIADINQQIVVKVTPAGSASLFAGTQTPSGPGNFGYNGDNILAIAAELNFPNNVATDQAGNVYIADTGNYRIRMVAAGTGMITTVAGNGTKGDTGDGSAATSAEISAVGVGTNLAGDLFISDGSTIRKVTHSNGNISTYAGGGTGGLGGPATSALLKGVGLPRVDNYGDLLIPVAGTPELLLAGPDGILQFGNQAVATTSAPLTITVENTGNFPLDFTQTTFTASGDFTVTGGTCENLDTAGSGGTCTLTVTFTPGTTGALTGTISMPSNAPGTPQMVLLQGTGTAAAAPTATLAPSMLTFASTAVGATATAQTLTLSNTSNTVLDITGITFGGANPSDFAQTSTCGETLAANTTCTISVTFTPASATSFAATISVADNATGAPQTATLSGMGSAAPAPVASLAPAMSTFASTAVGATATAQTLTLSNTGNAVLNISGITIGGANPSDFAETTTCGATLAANAMCTISVTFTPASAASFGATVTVTDNAAVTTQTATLSGSGTVPAAPAVSLSPSSLSYAGTVVGATATAQTITVSNTGNAVLDISGITIGGTNPSDFAETSTCGETLAVESMCTISVTFTPGSIASFAATVSVADNATGSAQTVALSGAGIAAPDFSVSALPPTQTVNSGGSTTYNVTVGSINGDFDNAVTLGASGLPMGATATFAPPAVTPGSESAGSVMTVQTASVLARTRAPQGHWPWMPAVTMAFFIPLLWWRRRDRVRLLSTGLLCALLSVGAAMLSGCGGGYYAEPPAQTYTITVTGTSGSTQHSTTVTLTVQ